MRYVMIRTTCCLTAAVFAVVFAFPVVTVAQSLPSKKEMAEIIDHAMTELTLGQTGAPPFHLVARLRYKGSAGAMDGSYELLWASRDEYREIFQLGTATRTELALKNKIYVTRNTPLITYQQRGFRTLMNLPLAVAPTARRKVKKVYQEVRGPGRSLCADLEDVYQRRKICVDSVNHHVVSDEFHASSVDGKFSFQATDFVSVGRARYPRYLLRDGPHETLEVMVDRLVQAGAFANDVFVPPAGAVSYDWCPDPVKHRTGINPPEQAWEDILDRARMDPSHRLNPPEYWSYFLVISPEGRVEEYIPIYHVDKEIDEEFGYYFKGARFPLRTCGNQPIRYEATFELGINARNRPAYLF